jgi:hypothetical protein
LNDPDFAAHCPCWVSDVTYIARARYGEQVTRYLDVFGRENVACYVFEEFFRDGLPLFPVLCGYLGIDADYRPENTAHNKAGMARSALLRNVLSQRMGWKEPLKKVIPARVRRLAMRRLAHLNNVERPLDPVPADAATHIRKSLIDDVQTLSRVIERPDLPEIWGMTQVDGVDMT